MLSEPLKCFIENENLHRFQGLTLGQTPCKVLRQGLYLFYPINIMPQIPTKNFGTL